jgi:protein-L-isoaspartate(D-aspartate) O-methyltransferase
MTSLPFLKFWHFSLIAAVLSAGFGVSINAQGPDRLVERQKMTDTLALRLKNARVRRDSYFVSLISALRETPRHKFVPDAVQASAYLDQPLDIGEGQTISAPFIVALMTSQLRLRKTDKVLEIGTGSGYQAAVLSQLVTKVYTIEIVEPLAREAAARLQKLGYGNVSVRLGDGYAGWPEQGPFDAIIVTAGATIIPPALLDQLKPGGRMVIPLGRNWAERELVVVKKARNGTLSQTSLGQVFFVDFTGRMPRRR